MLCEIISRQSVSQRKVIYYICLFALFAFVAFRYKVGCDWSGYFNIFQIARNLQITWQTTEVGFWTANKLLHYYELDYPYINIVAAIAFFLGLHALANRQPNPIGVLALSFPILIMNLAMSGIRQGIAVGFFCFACNAFVETRLVRFITAIGIGGLFHSSVLFFLVLAPFVRGAYSLGRVALGGLLSAPGIYYFLTSETFDLYSKRYVGSTTEAFGAPFRTGLLALTGIAFVMFLDGKWKEESLGDYKLVKICSYLMIMTFPLCLYSSVAGDRLGYYLIPVQLMILARLPLLIQGQYSTAIASIPYAVGGLFLITWISLSSLFEVCYSTYQLWL